MNSMLLLEMFVCLFDLLASLFLCLIMLWLGFLFNLTVILLIYNGFDFVCVRFLSETQMFVSLSMHDFVLFLWFFIFLVVSLFCHISSFFHFILFRNLFVLEWKKKERKGLDLDRWRGWEDLGRVRKGETVIIIYYMKINPFSIKKVKRRVRRRKRRRKSLRKDRSWEGRINSIRIDSEWMQLYFIVQMHEIPKE